MLSADLLNKYGLPEDEIVDAVECAVARTLMAAFQRTVTVRAEGELEIIADVFERFTKLWDDERRKIQKDQ